MMTLPPSTQVADMNKWMVDKLAADLFVSSVWQNPVADELEDMATSSFTEFGSTAISLGTGLLCGCTTLVIISRKGVYMAHYWESMSFDPNEDWLEEYGTVDDCFKKTFIKGLTEGISGEQVPLKASEIEDTTIRAYLMIPSETADGDANGYRKQWDEIKTTVNKLVPTLGTGDRWEEVKYVVVENDWRTLRTTARGRVLFKYDPDQNGMKKAALWTEYTQQHDDDW